MNIWERSCWWPIGLVLLESGTWQFPEDFCWCFTSPEEFLELSNSWAQQASAQLLRHDAKRRGEKVLTVGSWQTLFKPSEKCSRLTRWPSLSIMLLIELVSIPAPRFYNHLITACIECSWNSPLQLLLWKCTVDYKKVQNFKETGCNELAHPVR